MAPAPEPGYNLDHEVFCSLAPSGNLVHPRLAIAAAPAATRLQLGRRQQRASSGDGPARGFGAAAQLGRELRSERRERHERRELLRAVDMYIVFDKSGSMGGPREMAYRATAASVRTWTRSGVAGSTRSRLPQLGVVEGSGRAIQFFSAWTTQTAPPRPVRHAGDAAADSHAASNTFDSVLNSNVPGGLHRSRHASRPHVVHGANRRLGTSRSASSSPTATAGLQPEPDGSVGHPRRALPGDEDPHVRDRNGRSDVLELEKIARAATPDAPDTVGALNNACGDVNAPCRSGTSATEIPRDSSRRSPRSRSPRTLQARRRHREPSQVSPGSTRRQPCAGYPGSGVRSRCLHPGSSRVGAGPLPAPPGLRMRRSRVVACFASSTQQMNSLRARGVMSSRPRVPWSSRSAPHAGLRGACAPPHRHALAGHGESWSASAVGGQPIRSPRVEWT